MTGGAADDAHLDMSANDCRSRGRGLIVAVATVVMVAVIGLVALAAEVGTTSSVRIHAVCGPGPGVDPRKLGFDVERTSAPGVQLGPGRIESTHRLLSTTRYKYLGDDGTRAWLLSPVHSDIGFSCP